MDTDNRVMIVGGGGEEWVEVKEGIMGISGDEKIK